MTKVFANGVEALEAVLYDSAGAIVSPAASGGLTDTQLRAADVKVTLDGEQPDVTAKSSANYSATLPFTFKRTLVADTDQSIDVPTGTKFVIVYHALATPVHAVLGGEVTVPVAGAAGQHTLLCPPNSPMTYALWAAPCAVDTFDLHIRSASAGDVWVSFAAE